MLILNAKKLHLQIGERLLFDIKELNIYNGEHIGLIGRNGSGKSTLLKVLAQKEKIDGALINTTASYAYIEQLINKEETNTLSGGQWTKQVLREALLQEPLLLFADEPENYLDKYALKYLVKQLKEFKGAFILISHNRDLLNSVCNKTWELDNGMLTVYQGGYDEYKQQKAIKNIEQQALYESYSKEQKRVKKAMQQLQQKSSKVLKAPKRMGNSEARLHKMGNQRAKGNLDKAVKSLESRMEHMEKVDKLATEQTFKINLPTDLQMHQPYILQSSELSKSFGEKVVFDKAIFSLATASKTALIGDNGAGKSTLLQMIVDKDTQISMAKNVKIGYFNQFLSNVDLSATILENINRVSIHSEAFNRKVLAHLLFSGNNVFKTCEVLSGGERSKVSLAMLMLSNNNLLILDEVTSHMDLQSVEAIEQALQNYQGTLLFVSHDERFIKAIATNCLEVKKTKIYEIDLENWQ